MQNFDDDDISDRKQKCRFEPTEAFLKWILAVITDQVHYGAEVSLREEVVDRLYGYDNENFNLFYLDIWPTFDCPDSKTADSIFMCFTPSSVFSDKA